MQFRIADTFTASLGRLTNEQHKATNTTAFDLQIDPAQRGHNLRRVTGARVLKLLVGQCQPGHPYRRSPGRRCRARTMMDGRSFIPEMPVRGKWTR